MFPVLQKTFPTLARTWICALHIIWRHHGIIQFEYLNLIAANILHALVESQNMGKLLYAFKNVRNMEKFLEENAHAPDGTQPILARERAARP